MSKESLEEEKDSLIYLATWYRDDHSPKSAKDYYDAFIKEVKECTDSEQLEFYWKVSDGWLDY